MTKPKDDFEERIKESGFREEVSDFIIEVKNAFCLDKSIVERDYFKKTIQVWEVEDNAVEGYKQKVKDELSNNMGYDFHQGYICFSSKQWKELQENLDIIITEKKTNEK